MTKAPVEGDATYDEAHEDAAHEDAAHEDATSVQRVFDTLVPEEYARLRRLAWRFGVPEDEMDDAVQEVFATAWVNYPKFRRDCALTTWLTRIAINQFTSRRRALLRRLRTFRRRVEADERVPAPMPPDAGVRDAYQQAVSCIRRLPVKLRQVLVLHHLEEKSLAEVAETLGIPEATVRMQAFRARQKLRKMMKGQEPW